MKPSQPLMARLRLTTKQVGRGYYKGNRTGSMGFFLKTSAYIIDPGKLRTYVVPENLDDFKLTPFVTKSFLPTRTKYTTEEVRNGLTISKDRAFNGEDYLDLWENLNPREHDDWSSHWKSKRNNLKAKAEADLQEVIKRDEQNRRKKKLKGGRTLVQLKKQGL
ncbi:50S ribosomal protein YmL27 [Talaromyces stipitatus ATCC 10500]|uniref:50S ribosomal protein YmL27 n=1 Tax=Talaromyces stipitatus (strain ATCC 10500 / CBS 375.48 / QM 6759 / NRRL 1006) TaxID=441959 RepID=B8MGJ8_TALSN|nr:MRP-L27 domain-containing protein [Talaromyces stipitatus ATCC 10500]EED16749.1 50S ribosomal protein YmL27 [Talaromyces stipitatus ATCC 10500]